MAHRHLRIYHGPDNDTATLGPSRDASDKVSVPLGDVLHLLADAVQSNRTWLRDFENDEISISSDLYEVIMAYRHFRRPSA